MVGDDQLVLFGELGPLLVHDGDFILGIQGVMGVDLGTVPILEWGDDTSPVGVVFRVCRRDHEHIQRQPDPVALDLYVPLFHQVEQPHLNPFRQIWQLVDAEDAAVGAGNHSVVDHQLVGQVMPLGHLDGVDLTDEIGNGYIRSRQFFRVTVLSRDPFQKGFSAHLRNLVAADLADGVVGIIVDLATGDLGNGFVEQIRHTTNDTGLGLPAFAQQYDVLAGKDGIFDLWDDRLLEPDDSGEHDLFGSYFGDQVLPQLLTDGKDFIVALAERSDGLGTFRLGHAHSSIF